ncbi:MAG: zinc-ribbon domain-containing protein [Myxococcales bacterium]|nr:zinc-ribbon domain-containing protein [Myxococcales bacterium]
MDVTCEKCQTEYEFDDALVSEQGTSVRCTQCGHRFKVRRPTGGGPEVWIVRTVEGQTLEFRILRELKNAIASGKIGRDDVLSRGAGRPRRLASIAELEPFFTAPPRAQLSTSPGLGSLESSPRARKQTPSGLGPGPEGPTEGSVAIPLPRDPDAASVASHAQAFDDEERTAVKDRRATKELRMLGEEIAPQSKDPPTIPDPPRADEGPQTKLGVAPPMAPIPKSPDSITKTMSYGTPRERTAPASTRAAPASTREPEPVTGRRPLPDLEQTIPRTPPPKSTKPPAVAEPAPVVAQSTPAPAPAPAPAKEEKEAPTSGGAASSRAALPPPVVEPAPTPTPTPPPEVSAEPPRVGPLAKPDVVEMRQMDGRASVITPAPAEVRYSLSGEESDIVPSGTRTSSAVSRRSSSSRLIVGLVLGGAVAFGGVVLWQKYLPSEPPPSKSATDPRVVELLETGEKALREGDLESANEKFVKASGIDEKSPSVAKSLARLAVVRADLAWLELRVLAPDDRGRDKAKDRLVAAIDRAQKAVELASSLAKDDAEVARLSVDVKRIAGDVAGARKAAASIQSLASDETELVLGVLDMTEQNLAPKAPGWRDVLDRLGKAADAEGGLGRARAMLVYAAALSGDATRARAELDRLGKLSRSHPLESDLRRFLDRVDKGESPTLAIDDLPPVPTGGASGAPPDSLLKVAQDALSKGNYVKAEELYREIVGRDQSNAEALFGLAQASLGQGKQVPAKAFLERAVAANPSHAPAVMTLAGLKYDSGERAEAATLYRKALELGVSGKAAEIAKSRTQATPSSGPTSTPQTPPDSTTTGGAEQPPQPPPQDPATTGGSDVPPDL